MHCNNDTNNNPDAFVWTMTAHRIPWCPCRNECFQWKMTQWVMGVCVFRSWWSTQTITNNNMVVAVWKTCHNEADRITRISWELVSVCNASNNNRHTKSERRGAEQGPTLSACEEPPPTTHYTEVFITTTTHWETEKKRSRMQTRE